jgi:outer membrane protein OmpA-like peptidoglycan-associated protein
MAEMHDTHGAPPREIHVERKKGVNWIAWLLLLLGILALVFAIFSHSHKRDTAMVSSTASVAPVSVPPANVPPTPAVPVERVILPGGTALELQPKTLNYDLQQFLGSSDKAPRTFTFDKLNFDTGSAAIRPDDQATITSLSQILKAYSKTKITLTGYADARGTDPQNQALGEQRAKAVADALTAEGVDADRIVTASGGTSNPVATNATSSGRQKVERRIA